MGRHRKTATRTNDKPRRQIINISLYEFERLRSKYNAKHKTVYTYGQMVSAIYTGKIKLEEFKSC